MWMVFSLDERVPNSQKPNRNKNMLMHMTMNMNMNMSHYVS